MLATAFPLGSCSRSDQIALFSISFPSLFEPHFLKEGLEGCGSFSSRQGCWRMNGHYWLRVFSLAPYFANLWHIMCEIQLRKISEAANFLHLPHHSAPLKLQPELSPVEPWCLKVPAPALTVLCAPTANPAQSKSRV